MMKISNILVATDFGAASDSALTRGREFARTFGAQLHLLHVLEKPMMQVGPDAVGIDFSSIQADLEAAAQRSFDALVTAEDRQHLRAVTAIRTGGTPAFEIVAYAKKAGVDMIIMGTHGRGLISHLLLGSVAERVVRTAPCPVLTVGPSEHEFVVPDVLEVAGHAQK